MSDLAIYRSALRELTRPKRLIIAAILILLPAIFALIARSKPETYNAVDTYDLLMKRFVFGSMLILLTLVFSTGAITQEVEQKTIVYLLTRPVPRWRILLMKFAAVLTITIGTVWLTTILLAVTCFGIGGLRTSYVIYPSQIKDQKQFVLNLKETPNGALLALHEKFTDRTRNFLDNYTGENAPAPDSIARTVAELNRIMRTENLYTLAAYEGVKLPAEVQEQVGKKLGGYALEKFNRGLVQAVLPDSLLAPGAGSVQLSRDLLVLPIGVLSYGALFLCLATLFPRPLVGGLIFAFGWESWVPNLPGYFGRFSLATYLRTLSPHPDVIDSTSVRSLLSQLIQSGGKDEISQIFAWGALLVITVLALGIALTVFSNKEFVPREDV